MIIIYFIISQISLAILFYLYYDKLFKAYNRKRQAKIEKRKMEFYNRIITTEK